MIVDVGELWARLVDTSDPGWPGTMLQALGGCAVAIGFYWGLWRIHLRAVTWTNRWLGLLAPGIFVVVIAAGWILSGRVPWVLEIVIMLGVLAYLIFIWLDERGPYEEPSAGEYDLLWDGDLLFADDTDGEPLPLWAEWEEWDE